MPQPSHNITNVNRVECWSAHTTSKRFKHNYREWYLPPSICQISNTPSQKSPPTPKHRHTDVYLRYILYLTASKTVMVKVPETLSLRMLCLPASRFSILILRRTERAIRHCVWICRFSVLVKSSQIVLSILPGSFEIMRMCPDGKTDEQVILP